MPDYYLPLNQVADAKSVIALSCQQEAAGMVTVAVGCIFFPYVVSHLFFFGFCLWIPSRSVRLTGPIQA